jgi:GxxExxY protein
MEQRQPKVPRPIPPELEPIGKEIVDCAFKLHSALGAGLLESVYEVCLAHELTKRGLHVQRQLELPIFYDNIRFDAGLRIDLLVNEAVIVEVKAVESILPVHKAQVLTYLKMTNTRLGYLINFDTPVIKEGIRRLVL